jgi:hypothetical protein
LGEGGAAVARAANWPVFVGFVSFYTMVNCALLACMLWLFNVRWRVSI